MAKLPHSSASKQIEILKDQDTILNKLLDRLNSIVAQKTPFKKVSLPPGIANQLYNILIKENPEWNIDKKLTRKRLAQLYKDRLPKDKPPPDLKPRKLFQDLIESKMDSKEDRVPLGSILSPEQKSESDESVPHNSLMNAYAQVMKSLSEKPGKRPTTLKSGRKTRSQTKL